MSPRACLPWRGWRLFPTLPAARRHPTRCRPALEQLEDRLVPSVTPAAHVYSFDLDLTDALGGPALVADGGALSEGRYVFGANQGLRLTDALANTGTYSIVMTLELDSLAGMFNKLIDFENRTTDFGVYVTEGALQLYPGFAGADTVVANTDFHLALTRDGSTGVTNLYLNGVLQRRYTGFAASVAVVPDNILVFFEDDFETFAHEAVGGSVDHIAIYHTTLSAQEVAELAAGRNTPPSVAVHSDLVSVPEGQAAVNGGTWADVDLDAVVVSASVGTVVQNADGAWTWSYTPLDGPAESQTVVITATDSRGASSFASFSLVVNNVAPQFTTLTSSHASLHSPAEDGLVTITGAYTDAGLLDRHVVTVDWGDDSPLETLANVDQVQRTFSAGHRYAAGGLHTIRVTIDDGAGGVVTQSTLAAVTGIGLSDDGTLYVLGTSGQDIIHIDWRKRDDTLEVRALFDVGVPAAWCTAMTFSAANVHRIVASAGAGADIVHLNDKVLVDAILLGGEGDDHLRGGGGNNVLVGGAGRDHLKGSKGRDILIGGGDRDHLDGGRGRDLLISGLVEKASDLDALGLALQQWSAGLESDTLATLGLVGEDGTRDHFHGPLGDDLVVAGSNDRCRRRRR